MRPRLYLDADTIPALARILRAAGHDVVSAHEVGAQHLPDEEQLVRAAAEGRAVLTSNYRDFLAINEAWLRAGRPHAGILISYHQYQRNELGPFRDSVLAFLSAFSVEQLANTVQILDSFRRR